MTQTQSPAAAPPAGLSSMMTSPAIVKNPYPLYEMLRAGGAVVHVPGLLGLGAWVVTGHAAANAVLRGKQFGKETARVLPPEKRALIPQENNALGEKRDANMLFRDPPVHTRLRALVTQAFTPRVIEGMRADVAAVAERLVDEAVARGSMDLMTDFAFPLPVTIIAELLGVPVEDRDRFKAWSTALVEGLSPVAGPAEFQRAHKALIEYDDYMAGVIEERRREPRSDLISDLVRVHQAGDRLSQAELLGTCRLILTAGHETTVNLIGNGMLALLQHPEARAALAEDPALLPRAVDEMLRYDSPVQMTVRLAMEPVELGGHALATGDLLVVALGAANRDPAVFPEPARFDLRRANANQHVAFGAGIHFCLGASLARLEGEIAIGTLLRRLPRLAMAPGAELAWRPNIAFRGLQSLPVTF